MASSPAILHRRHEKDHLSSLNDRFGTFVAKMHQLQDQSKGIENATITAHTQQLANEMGNQRDMYERQLAVVRDQLDQVTADRNGFELQAGKHIALSQELEAMLADETATRKKTENALADAHRIVTEKDSAINDLHIQIAQDKNAHIDTNKTLDHVQSALSNVTAMHDVEAATRSELEAMVRKLTDQINFERDVHAKEIADLQNRINASDAALRLADDRLREHDLIDDQLANTLAKVKMQSHAELVRFQEEAEHSYRASLAAVKNTLEDESKNLAAALQENIHLKALVDDTAAKLAKVETKCAIAEDQNLAMIKAMENERQQATNHAQAMESVIRKLDEELNAQRRELSHTQNASVPIDIEIEAFSGLLDAEEKRLELKMANPASEILARSNAASIAPGGLSCGPSMPPSVPPSRPSTHLGTHISRPNSTANPGLSRPKSTPVTIGHTSPPPQKMGYPGSTVKSGRKSPTPTNGRKSPGSTATKSPRSAPSSTHPITTRTPTTQKWNHVPHVSEPLTRYVATHYVPPAMHHSRYPHLDCSFGLGSLCCWCHTNCNPYCPQRCWPSCSECHTGNLRILEVNPNGKYVRIYNTSTFQNEDIGGFILQQNVANRPAAVFRFPPRTILSSGAHCTVWSASSMGKHNPPHDFRWKEQHKWGTGPDCTTLICKPNGTAIAWTRAAQPYGTPAADSLPIRKSTNKKPHNRSTSDPLITKQGDPIMNPHGAPPSTMTHPHAVQPRNTEGGTEPRTVFPPSFIERDGMLPISTAGPISPVETKKIYGGDNKQSAGSIKMMSQALDNLE